MRTGNGMDQLMASLETMMHGILRSLETSALGQSPPVDHAAEERGRELRRHTHLLPRIPSHWRSLVRPPIVSAICAWRWGDGNLVLLGETGSGKTLGAAALATRLLTEATADRDWSRARRLVFVDAARLAIAREQHGLGEGEAPLVQRCLTTPLLFLDELGYLDKNTGIVEQVIDVRNKTGLPIVVTSGMQPIELQARYGSATARKLMPNRTGDTIVQVFGFSGSGSSGGQRRL